MEPTDIIVTTKDRLEHLQRTLTHIYERTRSPYRLHVIDDASEDRTAYFLVEEFAAGRIQNLLLRGQWCGAVANNNVGWWMSFSDPVVFVDDDVLCPDVEPDWLERGVTEMKSRTRLGALALNNPAGNPRRMRRPKGISGNVTFCGYIGGTFMFVRRAALKGWSLPHKMGLRGWPTTTRCGYIRKQGWNIAYLTETFCQHIGSDSTLRENGRHPIPLMEPVDDKTLRPPEKWAW